MKKLALSRLVARKKEAGVTMIEYALLAALISVMLITVLLSVKDELNNTFDKVVTELQNANAQQ
jgi:pilus assembly protein Flp/PilA